MLTKQQPCCARLTGNLTHEQNNLRSLARKAAVAEQKGRRIDGMKDMIIRAKDAVASAKQMLAEHEAEHAGEVV